MNFEDIDNIISQQFPDQLTIAEEDLKQRYWLSTGNYALNWAMSGKFLQGVPYSRVSSFEGLSGTGKSLIVSNLFKDETIDYILLIVSESGGTTKELFDYIGIPKHQQEKIRFQLCSSIDSFFIKDNGEIETVRDEDVPKFLKKKAEKKDFVFYEGLSSRLKRFLNVLEKNNIKDRVLIVLDSLGNLSTSKSRAGSVDMGKRALLISEVFKNIEVMIETMNVSFVFTNKLYTNIGDMWGDQYKASGGTGVEFSPSIRVRLEKVSLNATDKDLAIEEKLQKDSDSYLYEAIKATIVKSRYGTYKRNIRFIIDSRYGLNEWAGLFEILKDWEIAKGSTKYEIPGLPNKIYRKEFIESMVELKKNGKLKETFQLWETLLQEVEDQRRKKIETELFLSDDPKDDKQIGFIKNEKIIDEENDLSVQFEENQKIS